MGIKGLPYTGGKYGIIDQLIPHLERDRFTAFYDMMCGGGTVGANVSYNRVIFNDTNASIVNILRNIAFRGPDGDGGSISVIKSIINAYGLDDKDSLPYLLLRSEYNEYYTHTKNEVPFVLLTLMYHSYNNMVRFNKKGEFNVPFGKRTFNPAAEEDLRKFAYALYRKQASFVSGSIGLWEYEKEPIGASLFYFDPPYITGNAAYNKGWNVKSDKALMDLADNLDNMGHFWAISNAIRNNGRYNRPLNDWSKRYNVYEIEKDYKGSYKNRANRGKTREVLITNYD